jgi:D-sedoheptulose 7-phosphate isomerase
MNSNNQLMNRITSALDEADQALQKLRHNRQQLEHISSAAVMISQSFAQGGRAFSCGNGGSHCDAMHFAEELSGRFRENRPPFAAMAISDPAHISCTANDFGFDEVFSRFIEAHGRKDDTLLAISTSGKSKNVLKAAQVARSKGMHVIALTGHANSPLSAFAEIDVCTPGGRYADRVQELHIKVIHILIELIEELSKEKS